MQEIIFKPMAVGQGGLLKFELVDTQTAALIRGCNERTIRRMADEGELIAFKFGSVWAVHPTLIMNLCPPTGVHDP